MKARAKDALEVREVEETTPTVGDLSTPQVW